MYQLKVKVQEELAYKSKLLGKVKLPVFGYNDKKPVDLVSRSTGFKLSALTRVKS